MPRANGDLNPEEVFDAYLRLRAESKLLVEIARANLASDYLGVKVREILDQVARVEELL